MKNYSNKQNNEDRNSKCRRRVAAAMAGLLVVGTLAGVDAWRTASVVFAEEDESQGVTLNLADSDKDTAETELQTEAAETETEKQKETFADIDRVSGDVSIVATDVSDIVENCMPSIVSITEKSVEEVETYYYGVQEYETMSAASGIIIAQNDDELLIATNSHVVKNSTEITVGFTAEAEDPEDLLAPAKVKGMDKDYELAVVAVQLADIKEDVRKQLKIAQLGSSSDLKVGEPAIAIGNAMGYGQSVTSGIISALDREVTIDENFSQKLILMDAPVNHGNSGGALLNSKGQVIGINLAKEVIDEAEGMGYSIPIDLAIPVLQNLINKETRDKLSDSERGYLGITVVDVSADAKELYNIPAGAFVYEVTEGSAGEAAGIHKGDVVTKFDGESVIDKEDLVDKLSYYAVGETVTLEVQTANGGSYESREVEVTLQKGTDIAEEDEELQIEEPRDDRGNDQQDAQTYDDEDGQQQDDQQDDDFWFDGFGVPGGDDGTFFPFDDGSNGSF